MIILLMLPFLFSGFEQKWYIPYGTIAPGGRILVYDSDHDEKIELIFRRWIAQSFGVYFVEFVPPDSWDIYESIYVDSILVWDAGDFDNNGYADLITDGDASSGGPPVPIISVYESPDSFSYPTQEVWRDTVGFALVQPISVYDVDQDSFPEIFKLGWRKEDSITTYYPFGIYESVGDNQYDTIFMGTGLGSLSSTIAFGDFDSDGLNEFVIGNIDGKYQLWECIGNNNYQLLEQQQLPTVNVKDCFSVSDADGDGKMEFVVKGFWVYGTIDAFIFEAIADNTYEIIKTFNFPGGDYYGGYSEAGDVDGDSVPEIVLESASYVYIIKAAGNDSFYIWDTLPGNASGSSIAVYDIDGNGLSEIVISGNDETRIYEYDPGGVEEARSQKPEVRYGLQIYPNPFRDKLVIRYMIHDTGYKENVGQGFSLANSKPEGLPYICIYDVSGRLVKQYNYPTIRRSNHVIWDGTDDSGHKLPAGIYFVRFTNHNFRIVEKVIKLE